MALTEAQIFALAVENGQTVDKDATEEQLSELARAYRALHVGPRSTSSIVGELEQEFLEGDRVAQARTANRIENVHAVVTQAAATIGRRHNS